MSELIQTLWFEDVSFLHEQMLDTPVGRFSIRQMGIFLVFGLLAWLSSLAFADLVLKIVVAGAIFFAGVALFTRKIKTVSPEAHLLYLIRKHSLQIKQKHPTSRGKQPVEQTSKPMLLSATLGAPVKVVGALKDHTEKILPNKSFKVNINNTPHTKGTTDQEGYFCTYFTPDHLGRFEINIQLEDSSEVLQQITLQVNPKTQEEATQNAETKPTQT
ncbi:MAG: hypothetical protein LBQ98_06735 [Nitrososphaerota archaeon]|nr:hypothetical protein [Nitrososphaerota archaeon]